VAEALLKLMPAYASTPVEERCRLAVKAAHLVLPGAPWLADVVLGSWDLWAVAPESRQKLAIPTARCSVKVSVVPVRWWPYPWEAVWPWNREPGSRREELAWRVARCAMVPGSPPPPAPRMPRAGGTRPAPAPSRAPRRPTKRDAEIVAAFQWGWVPKSNLAAAYRLDPSRVTRVLHRWAQMLPLRLRAPLPAGRPRR
jgi:hypothetical protein